MSNTIEIGTRIKRIVTRPMGGWKYGKAYGVSIYELTRGTRGNLYWRFVTRLIDKKSLPQLRRMGWGNLEFGVPKIID